MGITEDIKTLIKSENGKETFRSEATVQLVVFETLDAIFQAALDRVDAEWVKDPGLQDKYDAETANRLMNGIDQLWRDCLVGKATAWDFERTVATWEGTVG